MLILILFLLVSVAVGLIGLLLKLLKKPLKWACKLLLHALFGFFCLLIFNLLGSVVGLEIPLTWFNAIVTGICGVPGVLLLLLIRFFLA